MVAVGAVGVPVKAGDASGARLVSVAAVPVMLIPHVPEAPVPVLDGASFAISALTKAVVAT